MKRRKRMGRPKVHLVPSRAGVGAGQSSVPPETIEILRDRARRTIVQEQQLAAKQRRLLEPVSAGSQAGGSESTIVRLAERIASRADFAPEMKGEPLEFAVGVPNK